MIDPDKRKAIFQLHAEGMSLREISRRLHVSRKTVRKIIQQQSQMPDTVRKDKRKIDPDLLRRLYHECRGWAERVHERLQEEEDIQIGYSTLTRILRDLGLGKSRPARCDHVPDEPGAEMQHDTSDYCVPLAGQRTKVIASLIYLRYSKRRYLKFYRVFNRFTMKCFFHEALMYWSHSAGQCIIDNTNLARLRGTGKRAVIAPEMAAFSKRYARPLVRQYQIALGAVLRNYPELGRCLVRCRYCGIRFLTHPCNARRRDLHCPFGCRKEHRRQCANRRGAKHYQTAKGRRNKKARNGQRSCREQSSHSGSQFAGLADLAPPDDSTTSNSYDSESDQPTSDPSADGGQAVDLADASATLNEASVTNSPMLSYLQMVANVIEGRTIGRNELVQALLTTMRQRSLSTRPRIEYVLDYLNRHPP